jgi:hypothetical protein
MDPEALLAEAVDLLVAGEYRLAKQLIDELQEWKDKGGFNPLGSQIGIYR